MTTERQMEANRRNAEKSTGPKTEEGKAKVARNATTHGLLSRQALLPGEDDSVFEAFATGLRASLAPADAAEELLVDQIVTIMWRYRRLLQVETGLFEYNLGGIERQRAGAEANSHTKYIDPDPLFAEFPSRRSVVTDEEAHAAAMRRLRAANARQEDFVPTLAQAFSTSERSFGLVARYSAMLHRQFVRTWHELERLQKGRSGQAVAPPAVVDIDVGVAMKGVNGEEEVGQ